MGTGIRAVASLGAGFVIAFVASWRLSLVVLGCLPIMIVGNAIAMKFIQGSSAEALQALSESGHVATESMTNIRTVACLNLQEAMLDRFRRSLDRPHAADLRKSRMGPVGLSVSNLLMFAMQALSFWAGAQFMGKGWMSFQDLLQCFFGLAMSVTGIGNAGGLVTDQAKIDGAKRSVFAIIDRPSRIDATADAPAATSGSASPAPAPANQGPQGLGDRRSDLMNRDTAPGQDSPARIEFRDVHFRYPGRSAKVLDGLSFVVEPGQVRPLAPLGLHSAGRRQDVVGSNLEGSAPSSMG
mmetsp:Transcript_5167/g.16491  ORF Transcript_5167/g.16491 Transcript_5167/m.16491 type:complete len:297 (+) Transcript_5167:2662-3552(+)